MIGIGMFGFTCYAVISLLNEGKKILWNRACFLMVLAVIIFFLERKLYEIWVAAAKKANDEKVAKARIVREQAIKEQEERIRKYREKQRIEEEKRLARERELARQNKCAEDGYIDCEIKNAEKCKQAFIKVSGEMTEEAYVAAADLISKNFKRDTIKWTDKVLDELGSIWNKTKYEIREFDPFNDFYLFWIKTDRSNYKMTVHGWASPLYETAILNGKLYVRVSEKVKRIVLANDCYKDRLYELHPEIKESYSSKALHTRTERAKMTKDLRDAILNRDHNICRICGRKGGNGVLMEVDHIIPVSKGGLTVVDNLQTLCWECNREKSNKVVA